MDEKLLAIREIAQEEVSTVRPDDPLAVAEERAGEVEINASRLAKMQTIAEVRSHTIIKLELENDRLKIANERLNNELLESQELHSIRKTYTGRLFGLIVGWLIFVLVYVALTATLRPYFNLSDGVLIAFITSTTVSVLGLFVLVAKWLFPNAGRDDAERKPDNKRES